MMRCVAVWCVADVLKCCVLTLLTVVVRLRAKLVFLYTGACVRAASFFDSKFVYVAGAADSDRQT